MSVANLCHACYERSLGFAGGRCKTPSCPGFDKRVNGRKGFKGIAGRGSRKK